VRGGFDHAVWGADVVLEPVNLCAETLDGIRNHSWSRPAPVTPEGEVVSWADRIAYVCHDFEDAVRAGIVTGSMLPEPVRELCGTRRSRQLHAFISSVVDTARVTGEIGMHSAMAEVLAEFRVFDYERIYMRPASMAQGQAVVRVLRALVEYYADRPNALPFPDLDGVDHPALAATAGSPDALREAVTYVAGMTDRFAFTQAVAHLGWDPASLPAGLDLAIGR
jgi:dGTPase